MTNAKRWFVPYSVSHVDQGNLQDTKATQGNAEGSCEKGLSLVSTRKRDKTEQTGLGLAGLGHVIDLWDTGLCLVV